MRRELITAIEQDGLNNRIVNMLFIVHLNSGNESEPDWIPVDTGLFPRDNENVQITYLGIYEPVPLIAMELRTGRVVNGIGH